jgi:osmotically inducible protein OsmC
MALKRTSTAVWHGTGPKGNGTISMQSGAFKEQPYSANARFQSEDGKAGTNPEELIAAAHAACYSMALSNILASGGHTPTEVRTTVTLRMRLEPSGASIVSSHLECEGRVPGISAEEFDAAAAKAKDTCPVSRLLKPGLETLTYAARLV